MVSSRDSTTNSHGAATCTQIPARHAFLSLVIPNEAHRTNSPRLTTAAAIGAAALYYTTSSSSSSPASSASPNPPNTSQPGQGHESAHGYDAPKPVEDRHGDSVGKHSIAAHKNQNKVREGKFSGKEFDNHEVISRSGRVVLEGMR
jgi:hypothetical protein